MRGAARGGLAVSGSRASRRSRARAIFDTRPLVTSSAATRLVRGAGCGGAAFRGDGRRARHSAVLIGACAVRLQPERPGAPRACARAPLDSIHVGCAGRSAASATYFRSGRDFFRARLSGVTLPRCVATSMSISAATCCVTTTVSRSAPRIGMAAAERVRLRVSGAAHCLFGFRTHWTLLLGIFARNRRMSRLQRCLEFAPRARGSSSCQTTVDSAISE